MAPKRPTKRRGGDDDDDGGRPNKKAGKGKKVQTYDTYDEALDGTSSHPVLSLGLGFYLIGIGGVEMEEKGERYRDGEKVGTGS